jgi:hypothetical protein
LPGYTEPKDGGLSVWFQPQPALVASEAETAALRRREAETACGSVFGSM